MLSQLIVVDLNRHSAKEEKQRTEVAASRSFPLHCSQRMVLHPLALQRIKFLFVSLFGCIAPFGRRKWKQGKEGTPLTYGHRRETLRSLAAEPRGIQNRSVRGRGSTVRSVDYLAVLKPDCLRAPPSRSRHSSTG